jgi:hypothetical protein
MHGDVLSGRCRDIAVRAERIANEVSRAIDRVVRVSSPRSHLQARAAVERDGHATHDGPSFHRRWPEVNRRVEHDVAEARQA